MTVKVPHQSQVSEERPELSGIEEDVVYRLANGCWRKADALVAYLPVGPVGPRTSFSIVEFMWLEASFSSSALEGCLSCLYATPGHDGAIGYAFDE